MSRSGSSTPQVEGDLKRVRGIDVLRAVEEAVATHTVSFEARHSVGNFEGRGSAS